MRKRMLAICLAFAGTSSAYSSEFKFETPSRYVYNEINNGHMSELTVATVDFITKEANFELRARNENQVADEMMGRWNSVKGQMMASFDLGDHTPLNDYLAQLYQQLEDVLGPEVISQTRLYDIKVINFGIPVVFDPTMSNGTWNSPTPKQEYALHFVPVAGTFAYWAARAACQSSGVPRGLCGPASSMSEKLMVERFAPDLSNQVYDRANAF
ncbi:MAG: hypothetical protein AB7T49_07990 [Oligoflexales bacterium]